MTVGEEWRVGEWVQSGGGGCGEVLNNKAILDPW